ncbi:MAG: hypothetical protein AB7N65_25670 [Vicinamibacterales bacterium]
MVVHGKVVAQLVDHANVDTALRTGVTTLAWQEWIRGKARRWPARMTGMDTLKVRRSIRPPERFSRFAAYGNHS